MYIIKSRGLKPLLFNLVYANKLIFFFAVMRRVYEFISGICLYWYPELTKDLAFSFDEDDYYYSSWARAPI